MTRPEIMNRASAIIDDLPERPDDSDFSTAKREICRLVEDAIRDERKPWNPAITAQEAEAVGRAEYRRVTEGKG